MRVYSRFNEGVVYTLQSHRGFECCQCSLSRPRKTITVKSAEDLIIHLHHHLAVGHEVPEKALQLLSREIGEPDTGQPRSASATEAATNVITGAGIAWVLTMWVLPLWGHAYAMHETFEITAVYASAAFIRSYCLRRCFDRRSR